MSISAVDCSGRSSFDQEKVAEDDPRVRTQTADTTSPDLTVAGNEKGLTTGASATVDQTLCSHIRCSPSATLKLTLKAIRQQVRQRLAAIRDDMRQETRSRLMAGERANPHSDWQTRVL